MLTPEALALPSVVSVEMLPDGAALTLNTGEVLEVPEDYPSCMPPAGKDYPALLILTTKKPLQSPAFLVAAGLERPLMQALRYPAHYWQGQKEATP